MPLQIEKPLLDVNEASDGEHGSSKKLRKSSRSPHPYSLLRPEPPFTTREIPARSTSLSIPSGPPNYWPPSSDGVGFKPYHDPDSRKSRHGSDIPSDSGTEADDECEPFLKGLPAPPPKLRKGVKGGTISGTASPLLTPSYLDDEKRKEVLEAQFKHRTASDETTTKTREKFTRRRRAELIRRTTETTLFLSIGCIASHELLRSAIPRGLVVFAAIVCGTYLLYPFRLYLHHRFFSSELRRSGRFLQVPAAFDPATLLYPVLLPVFVVMSILPEVNLSLTINLILGIAAMPRTIIPSQDSFSGHTSSQYLLTLLICASVRHDPTMFKVDSTHMQIDVDPEVLSLLYPLHQALLPTLGYLTTTSLLPAELQLMSISIINVLLLSSSPQALILQALLWLGGLSMFVLCRHVLQWEVSLARIPSWRFRKEVHRNRLHLNIRRVWKELIHGRLGSATFIKEGSEDSDSDRSGMSGTARSRIRHTGSDLAIGNDNSALLETWKPVASSPSEPFASNRQMKMDGYRISDLNETRRRRSVTLPSFVGSLQDVSNIHQNATIVRFQHMMPRSFRSLTKDEAAIVKWLYALYTYVVVVFLIAVPIRSYIGKLALFDQEPVGWALGYLFGDIIRSASMKTESFSQQSIAMPVQDIGPMHVIGWAEDIRWRYLGAANTRLLISAHCICTIGLGLMVVFQLRSFADVDTRRKVFHGMMVVMFLPTTFVDPGFVALALILVLAIFLLLDLFRASQLPPLSRPLTNFLAPYVDGRDHRGPVIVSHIFLLIGCSIPLWLSLASAGRSGMFPWRSWEVPTRDLSMVCGVVCVGMGDAAASLIGRRYGVRRWCWSGGKSLEGSAAFAIAVLVGLGLARLWLLYGGWEGSSGDGWSLFFCKAAMAACGASLTEAVLTGGNDNVIVPVILWLLVRGLAI
ncbi:MAG: hypothetical protein Q9219_000085 [cf. Caloplaca sp. 3 TL-2023]